ncbi:transposase domain-containing protein [Streptomyces sp. NBC_00631]|uniref:hypothetical protein n=1 Tax=Streptomyces sp. NBC_00631 TaxID=2975793 RepID=UPI0030E27A3D
MYFVLAMCLFSGQAHEEVTRLLVEGLAWSRGWRGHGRCPPPRRSPGRVPGTAPSKARPVVAPAAPRSSHPLHGARDSLPLHRDQR